MGQPGKHQGSEEALASLHGGQVVGEDLAPGSADHRRASRRASKGLVDGTGIGGDDATHVLAAVLDWELPATQACQTRQCGGLA
eukprot:5391775-Alexandrium_andersonii.AAC.1